MNVTFISDEASQIPMEVCWLAKRLNIPTVEIRTILGGQVVELSNRHLLELRSIFQDQSLSLCCLASPVFKCDIDSDIFREHEVLKRSVEVAVRLDCNMLRIFSFFRRCNREQYENRICDYISRAG